MTNLKNLLLVGGLAGSLALSGCGDNKKYQDFANFIKKEGSIDSDGNSRSFSLLKDKKRFSQIYIDSEIPSEHQILKYANLDSLEKIYNYIKENGEDCGEK